MSKGGKRENSGRHAIYDVPMINKTLKFPDYLWQVLKKEAIEKKVSLGKYIRTIIEDRHGRDI